MNFLAKLNKFAVFPFVLVLISCGGGGGDAFDDKSVVDNFTGDEDACSVFDLTPSKISNGEMCIYAGKESSLVKVEITSLEGSGICTGTIISDNAVLTAAHCISDSVQYIDIQTSNGVFAAVDYAVAPTYRLGTRVSPAFSDAAIIRIDGRFNIKPMPLLFSSGAVRGEKVFIGGFGQVDVNDDVDGAPRAGEAVVADVSGNHIVLRFEGNQAHPCFGDSGGPVSLARGSELALAGVVSQSDPSVDPDDFCEYGDITLYTSVIDPDVKSFIKKFGGNISER